MCNVSVTAFRCMHSVTKSTDCAPASRNSSKHTISHSETTSTQLCPECQPKPGKWCPMRKRVTSKLKLAKRSTPSIVGPNAVSALYAMGLPTALHTRTKPLIEPKLSGDAIGQAHSVTRERLSSTPSNPKVLRMIKKEQAKNRRPDFRNLTSSSSSDSSSDESEARSSLPASLRPSRPSATGEQDVALSGTDYRNTLPSQRPVYGKLALRQNNLPDALKIGVSLPPLTNLELEVTNQPMTLAQQQAQELYLQDIVATASLITIPEFPGSLLEIPSKARRAKRRQQAQQPIELAAPLSDSRARGSTSKVSLQGQPIELPAPLSVSRAKVSRSVVSQRSYIPLILQPGYLEPDRTSRLKPFAIPEIVITPPTPLPQEKPTSRLAGHHTPIQVSSPVLNSKRGKDYQSMNSTRSSTEIVLNHMGNLVPRYADQELPIVGIQSTSPIQRHSAKRASPSRAELPNPETLFEFAKKCSAWSKEKGIVGDIEQDYAHYARCSSPTWNEVEASQVNDESLSHRESWSSVGSFEELVATKLPLVHGPSIVRIAGAPSNRTGVAEAIQINNEEIGKI